MAWPSTRLRALALALGLTLAGLGLPAHARSFAVVELFTAQGCDSCPSGDALFRALAERDDLIALSFHVDYWNYAGWTDPFASRSATERQRAYARRLGLNYLYTPQLVINGVRQVPATDADAVRAALDESAGPETGTLEVAHAPDGLHVSYTAPAQTPRATLWLVLFDRRYVTEVTAGDNAGTVLVNDNVVRGIRKLAVWQGAPLDLRVAMADLRVGQRMTDGCAILVQTDGEGAILAATRLWLPAN